MLTYKDIDPTKKAFIFELDDVLFPKQDYLLQVYYLFANLLEYVEHTPDSNELTGFFKETYSKEGDHDIFKKASAKFAIDKKHEDSFLRLHVNAKLPLKLLLYKEMLNLLTYIIGEGKSVFILTKGNPLIQINKIKQMDWNGLDSFIKTYFYDEIILKSELRPIEYILRENNILPGEAIFFSSYSPIGQTNEGTKVENINAKLFLKH
jgi:FMN phosphatase YigB (HAD superfamily)